MSWESIVSQLIGSGRPRSVYSLAQSWTQLAGELQSLSEHLTKLKDMTTNDALTPGWRPTMPSPPKGKGWTGPAGDAFREHVAKLAKEAAELVAPANSIGSALGRVGDTLSAGISKTPVPIFQDRQLPGGVDVHDVVNGGTVGKDAGTEFAQRLWQDMSKAGKYYTPGGFKVRVDELNRSGFADASFGGRVSGSAYRGITDSEEYRRQRDSWYAKNQAVATTAVAGVLSSYREEFSNVAPIVNGGSVSDLAEDPGTVPGVPGAGGGAGSGAGGSGLAGIGGGLAVPGELATPASGSTALVGANSAAASGLGGSGSAGVGARAAGFMGAGVPGMFSQGSASAGTGRSPMPALTSANKAMGLPTPDGIVGEGWAEATNWSRDEEDVWGTDSPDFPPGVLR